MSDSIIPILEHYYLDQDEKVVTLEKQTKGMENENYYVKTSLDREFIFRKTLDREKSASFIQHEICMVQYLEQNGLKVPKIFPTKQNQLVLMLQDSSKLSCYVLFEFIKNSTHLHSEDATLNHIQQLGFFTGQYHALTMGKPFIQCNPQTNIYYYERCHSFLQFYFIEQQDYLQKHFKTQLSILKSKIPSLFSNQIETEMKELICSVQHGDLHGENLLVSSNDSSTITAIIDWDDCFYGACLHDIIEILFHWCLESSASKGVLLIDKSKTSTFLNNYFQGRKLQLTEKESFYFKYYFLLFVLYHILYLRVTLKLEKRPTQVIEEAAQYAPLYEKFLLEHLQTNETDFLKLFL